MSDPLEGLLRKLSESEQVAAAGTLDDIKRETFRQFGGADGVVAALKGVYDTAESDQVRSKIMSDLFSLVVQSEKQAASKGPAEMSDDELSAVIREAVPAFLPDLARERFGDDFAAKTIGEFLSPV